MRDELETFGRRGREKWTQLSQEVQPQTYCWIEQVKERGEIVKVYSQGSVEQLTIGGL